MCTYPPTSLSVVRVKTTTQRPNIRPTPQLHAPIYSPVLRPDS